MVLALAIRKIWSSISASVLYQLLFKDGFVISKSDVLPGPPFSENQLSLIRGLRAGNTVGEQSPPLWVLMTIFTTDVYLNYPPCVILSEYA